jgi:hypothetical protein
LDIESSQISVGQKYFLVNVFAYNKSSEKCYRYSRAITFMPDISYETGVRIATGLFAIRANTEALGFSGIAANVASRAACEDICMRETGCKIFTYNKSNGLCYRYSQADFKSNEGYDSGVRIETIAPPTSAATPVSTGLFTIRTNTEVTGTSQGYGRGIISTTECENVCTREPSCNTFTYDKKNGICYRFMQRDILLRFKSNEQFDSGIRN